MSRTLLLPSGAKMEVSLVKFRSQCVEEKKDRSNKSHSVGVLMDPAIWGRLPGEILDRILLCLPIPNLFCLRCVSKSWDSTIRSKSFNKMYLEMMSRGPSWLFMCSSFNCRYIYSSFHINIACRQFMCVCVSTLNRFASRVRLIFQSGFYHVE